MSHASSRPSLVVCTSSTKKFNQIQVAFASLFDCVQDASDVIEIQGNPEEILKDKVSKAYKKHQQAVLVDDVSFHFEKLNGFPGPYIKDMVKAMNIELISNLFKDTSGEAVCRMALKTEDKICFSIGVVRGKIVSPSIPEGYGFEPVFIPEGSDKTFAEMSVEEKNNNSHRGRALDEMIRIANSKW